ncbi:hypothetical protein KCV87_27930 [Actinosynnema pretiosum subsp. pretiosum]|uniref:Uncharacterized protein n=2 Tax=Actinosynnema TaxID=40566 RepID=C6WB32_ACTMD|nr:hypothetical protein [Actinosynnema mirum]ACU39323.1 hypothetical protein Amir_5505 [Actinosynnema mirum DSM 43827]AXX32923.1 hypothetical protein APASM_5558 [Actinosynnema pretiosum subsp. pretiosum]QUF03215.1 hypothetical protein KCV87_27930 [Actinosynnema pretiosum subsp. pretiosum]
MTEPVTPLDEQEQQQLVRQIGRAMLPALPPDWQRVRTEYRAAGRHIEVDMAFTGPDGQQRPVRPPIDVVQLFGRLRAGMYEQDRGTWLSAVYEIEAPSAFAVDFDAAEEPRWRNAPPMIGFQDELRTFPRTDELIPDWLRQRAGMPPRQVEQAAQPEQGQGGPQQGGPQTPPQGFAQQGPPTPGQGIPGQQGQPGFAQGQQFAGQPVPHQQGPGPQGQQFPGQPGGGFGQPGGQPQADLRTARVYDGRDQTGRPVVRRQPVDPQLRERLLAYLESAPVVLSARDTDVDEFAPSDRDVPLNFRTDGTWVWAGAVSHYLRKHGVPPEPALVSHIIGRGFQLAAVDERTQDRAVAMITGQ